MNRRSVRRAPVASVASVAAVASVASLVLIGVFAPHPAAGAAGGLEVSRDGVLWAPTYPGYLLSGDVTLVPGGTAAGVVFVHNAAAGEAELTLAASNVRPGAAGGDAHLEVTVTRGGATVATAARSLTALTQVPQLGVRHQLEVGGIRRIDVALRLDGDATNEMQLGELGFDLVVQLRGERTVVPIAPEPPDTPDRPLPWTGAPITRGLIAAALLTAAGLGLRTLSRRRA